MKNLEKIYQMKFSKVYPLLVNKAVKKDRTTAEVNQIIYWLTGYDEAGLKLALDKELSYKAFFDKAPNYNPNAELIRGVICGCRVEDISDDTYKKVRQLDKLIDELAKGRKMEKILRKNEKS